MDMWFFMLGCTQIIPGIILFRGIWFLKKPPGKINWQSGYRTVRSVKNQETWEFAHRHCGRVWCIGGSVLMLFAMLVMLVMFLALGQSNSTVEALGAIICTLEFGMMVYGAVPTERALERKFGV